MNQTIQIGSKLALICAVAAIVLALVASITQPKIAEIQEQRLKQALEAVAGEYEIGDRKTVEHNPAVLAYYPMKEGAETVGYVLRLMGQGYGGEMVILAGYHKSGKIFSAKLTQNAETPGLGKVAEKSVYMEKFIGTGSEKPVPTRKDQLPPEQAEAITGATITFRGIGDALARGSEFVESLGEGND